MADRQAQQMIAQRKQTKYAWAKFYEMAGERHEVDYRHYRRLTETTQAVGVPEHIKQELKTLAQELKKNWECPICYEMIEHEKLYISNCGHFYCQPCLELWKQQQRQVSTITWKCCSCNRSQRFND
jgi:Zinc finger, C3HC4 type (RING finger)